METPPKLLKAYQEKDWDTLLNMINGMLGQIWYSTGLKYKLGEAWKEDAFQEAKMELFQKLPTLEDKSSHLAPFIYRFCWGAMRSFADYIKVRIRREGTKLEVEDDEGHKADVEVPFDDKLEAFLDLQLVKDHIASYKSKPFRKAMKLYLEGYTKREAAKKANMWAEGLMPTINIFILRVRNELTDEYVDEEQYIKENVRPAFVTYVRKHLKRRLR